MRLYPGRVRDESVSTGRVLEWWSVSALQPVPRGRVLERSELHGRFVELRYVHWPGRHVGQRAAKPQSANSGSLFAEPDRPRLRRPEDAPDRCGPTLPN